MMIDENSREWCWERQWELQEVARLVDRENRTTVSVKYGTDDEPQFES